MTHQPSFSQAEFAGKKKITRREKYLARMDEIIPWSRLLAGEGHSVGHLVFFDVEMVRG